jgi:hypothetical protein
MVPCQNREGQEKRDLFRIRKSDMKLLSAAEDFAIRTLGNVQGTWGKLLYLGSLRDSDGRYCHWGLAQVHGEAESQTAARDAHLAVLKQVLRKPIKELWSEVADATSAAAKKRRLEQALREHSKLLPAGCSRRSESHFNSVLQALAELDRARKEGSTRPTA